MSGNKVQHCGAQFGDAPSGFYLQRAGVFANRPNHTDGTEHLRSYDGILPH